MVNRFCVWDPFWSMVVLKMLFIQITSPLSLLFLFLLLLLFFFSSFLLQVKLQTMRRKSTFRNRWKNSELDFWLLSIRSRSDQNKALITSSCVRTHSALHTKPKYEAPFGANPSHLAPLWPSPRWESSLRARECLALSQGYLQPSWSVFDHNKLF